MNMLGLRRQVINHPPARSSLLRVANASCPPLKREDEEHPTTAAGAGRETNEAVICGPRQIDVCVPTACKMNSTSLYAAQENGVEVYLVGDMPR